jgi:hypothetical protein
MGPWAVRNGVNRCFRTGRGPMLRFWDSRLTLMIDRFDKWSSYDTELSHRSPIRYGQMTKTLAFSGHCAARLAAPTDLLFNAALR